MHSVCIQFVKVLNHVNKQMLFFKKNPFYRVDLINVNWSLIHTHVCDLSINFVIVDKELNEYIWLTDSADFNDVEMYSVEKVSKIHLMNSSTTWCYFSEVTHNAPFILRVRILWTLIKSSLTSRDVIINVVSSFLHLNGPLSYIVSILLHFSLVYIDLLRF